jgi:Fic family protein
MRSSRRSTLSLTATAASGGLLMTLLLCSERVPQEPLLYLSLYFKQNRDAYCDHVQRVRTDGASEDWLRFSSRA